MRGKTLAAILGAVLILNVVGATTGLASPEPDEHAVNNYLLRVGNYPAEVVDALSYGAKKDLFLDKAVYVTHMTEKSRLVDRESDKAQGGQSSGSVSTLSSNTGDVSTQVLDGADNFTGTMVVSDVADSINGRLEYKLTYNWDWNYAPWYSLEDKFGLAWTKDWTLMNAYYEYNTYGTDWNGQNGRTKKNAWCNCYTEDMFQTGVGWEYDILFSYVDTDGMTIYPTHHWGYGSVRITKWSNKSGTWDNSSTKAKYFHKEATISSPTFTFGKEPSVSLTVITNYDYSNYSTGYWDWNNYNY